MGLTERQTQSSSWNVMNAMASMYDKLGEASGLE